jgi:hypothetical protein
METVLDEQELTVQELADQILNQAVAQDLGQPHDDMSVVVMQGTETSVNLSGECHSPCRYKQRRAVCESKLF